MSSSTAAHVTQEKGSMAHLSKRALANLESDDIKRIMRAGSTNGYDADYNPTGVLSMGVAENRLMHQEITDHINANLHLTKRMLTYGDGSVGSNRLRQALARFMNTNFSPKLAFRMEHVAILAGVSTIIDDVCYCLCEEGEGVLLGKPLYVGFISDIENRARVKPVLVSMGDVDPLSLEAVDCYERALKQAERGGVPVRALILCHPHNPLGTCYDPEVLMAYVRLCAKYNIHLVSDEVYALSIFPTKDQPRPQPFTSILTLDTEDVIDPALLHVLYGMSKDFCSNGIRIGAFVSQVNPSMHAAMRAISKFSWASSLADEAWCTLLEDDNFLELYFKTLVERLTEAYEHCASFLKQHDVPYVKSSAGPFMWVDMSRFLTAPTLEAERDLAWKMISHGVWLATGEAYRSEQPGWFRMTFALPKEDRDIGLGRLAEVLREAHSTRP